MVDNYICTYLGLRLEIQLECTPVSITGNESWVVTIMEAPNYIFGESICKFYTMMHALCTHGAVWGWSLSTSLELLSHMLLQDDACQLPQYGPLVEQYICFTYNFIMYILTLHIYYTHMCTVGMPAGMEKRSLQITTTHRLGASAAVGNNLKL